MEVVVHRGSLQNSSRLLCDAGQILPPRSSMRFCNLQETLGVVTAIVAHNPELFNALPQIPEDEARVLHVHPQGRGFDVVWAGLAKDLWCAAVEYEVRVELKCLYEQAQHRMDRWRGWSSVVFLITQDSEPELHRILLRPGRHKEIAAIGCCDCSMGH